MHDWKMVVFIRFCHFSNTAISSIISPIDCGCVGKMTEPDKNHHFPAGIAISTFQGSTMLTDEGI